jgi:hypothetical protein
VQFVLTNSALPSLPEHDGWCGERHREFCDQHRHATQSAPTNGGSIPAVYAQAYEGGNGKRYVVLTNKSASTAVARIMQDGVDLNNSMQMTFVTGTDPSLPNFGTVPDNVPIQTQTVADPGAVTIPPYSVARLEWSVSPCNYTMSFGGQVFPASGGSGTINFIAPANCPWTVCPGRLSKVCYCLASVRRLDD